MTAFQGYANDPYGFNSPQAQAALASAAQHQQAQNARGVVTYGNGTQQSPVSGNNITAGNGSAGNALEIALGTKKGYDSAGVSQNYNQYANALSGLGQQSNSMTNANLAQNQALGATNYMQGAQQAYQAQLQNYGQQQGAATYLQNQAMGNVASPADLQMQAGLANANNQAQSAAYSQQGGVSPGLTQRNLLNSQAQQNAAVVNQGAQMRAQETQSAQQNYATMLNNMGQTASNMNQAQQNMGQFQYNQGQNALQLQNQFQQTNLGFQQGNATNAFNAANNIYNTRAGYNQQQSVNAINTIGSGAAVGATLLQNKS